VVYEDPRRADEMLTSLSELLRRTLNPKEPTIPLREEIEILELYLDMMQSRFEDKLAVEMTIDSDARELRVPPLLLQPLVENSIKYGADPRTDVITVHVSAERRNGHLHLEVSDRGPGRVTHKDGLGLTNSPRLRRRRATICLSQWRRRDCWRQSRE